MNVFELVARLTLDSSEYDSGLDRAKGNADGLGSALAGGLAVAGAAIGAATAAVAGFAKESVGVGTSFDASMSQVAATMGMTKDELNTAGSEAQQTFQTLRDFAQEMGSATAFSASEAADALNFMALAGYDANTSIEMLPNVLNLAAAGGMELATASDMITDSQSALGLTIDETAELVDKMAKASSKSNTSVSQLGSAILTVGGTAKDLSGGTTELATALGILADNGIKGAEGGTALRNILLSLTPKSEDAAKAMESIGFQAYTADGEMRPLADVFRDMSEALGGMSTRERQEVLSNIFNKVDLKSVNALLGATGDSIGVVSTALDESGVDWEKYRDKAWAAGENISDGVIDELVSNIGNLGTASEELRDYLHFEYEIDYEDADAILASLAEGVENNTDRWDELTGYIDDATGAAQAMADTQLDNLNGDITIMQSALEGAKIAISDKLSPTLREFVQEGTSGISNLTKAFKEDGLSGAMDALGGVISDALGKAIELLPDFVDAGVKLIGALAQGVTQNLPLLADAAVKIITSLADGLDNNLPEIVPSAAEVVLQIVDSLTGPNTLGDLVDAALAIITGLAEGLIKALPVIIKKAPQIIDNIVTALNESAPKIIEAGFDLFVALVENLPGIIAEILKAVPQIVDSIISALDGLHDDLAKVFSEAWEAIKEVFSDAGDWFKEKFGVAKDKALEAWNDVKEKFSPYWEKIKEAFSGAGDWFKTTFETAKTNASDAWNDIKSKFDAHWKNLQSAFSTTKEWFKTTFETAKTEASNAWNNIKSLFDKHWQSVQSAFSATKEWFKTTFDSAKTEASNSWDNVKSLFDKHWQNVQAAFQNTKDWFQATFETAKTNASNAWDNVKSLFDRHWQNIQYAFQNASSWFQSTFETAKDYASNAWSNVQSLFSSHWSSIQSAFSDTGRWFQSSFQEAKDLAVRAWDGIGRDFSFVWDTIKSAFDFREAWSWGADMLGNFIDGVRSKIDELRRMVAEAAETVADNLGFSEPKEGPLSNFHTYAPDMMALFAKGIRENEHLITDQIGKSFDFGEQTIDYSARLPGRGRNGANNSGADMTAAFRDAMRGVGVYMDGKRVGALVTINQGNTARAWGV